MQAEDSSFPVLTVEQTAAPAKGAIKIGPFGSQLRKEEMVTAGVKIYGQENIILGDWLVGNRRITRSKYLALKSCELVPGDVVLTMMGTIGRCAVFPDSVEPGIMDSHLLRVQPDTMRMDRDFLRNAGVGSLVAIARLHQHPSSPKLAGSCFLPSGAGGSRRKAVHDAEVPHYEAWCRG